MDVKLIVFLLLLYILHGNAILRPPSNTQTSFQHINLCPQGCSCMGESLTCENWSPQTIPPPFPAFATILTLLNIQFTTINETFFYKTPDLRWLQITQGSLSEFPKFPQLLRLSYLDLSQNNIKHLPSKSFINTPYITQLNLSSNAIETFHNNFFEGLTNLRILDLSHNNLIKGPGKSFFKYVKTLNYLNLSYMKLNDDIFEWVNQLSFLYSLNLSHNNITRLNIRNSVIGILDISFNPLSNVPSISDMPGISELYASHTHFETLEFAHFSNCDHLKILDLSYSNLSVISDGIFRNCDQLYSLRLNHNLNLKLISHKAFQGLTELSALYVNDCYQLEELENQLFSHTPSLSEVNLSNTGLQVLPPSLTTLHNLTIFNIQNTTLLCNCHAQWIPEWVKTVNHSQWTGIEQIMCKNNGPTTINELQEIIEKQICEETAIYVPENWITVKPLGETAVLHCNTTGNPIPKIMWITPNKLLHTHNNSEHGTWLNHKIKNALYRADNDQEKFEVLDTGEILVHNFNREDIGRYRCFAYNGISNASIEMFLGVQDDPFRALVMQSILFGFCCSALFLITTLIIQFIRMLMDRFGWECCCCKNRITSRANQIKQLLESVEIYKTAQLEKLRENYTSQVAYIKESCYSQMEKVRDSYSHQSKNLKDLCDYSTQQFTGARDQYVDQVNKIRDYSVGQINRVRENYVFQRQRVRKFSGHQLLRLRESYKYQQKTLNKLLETLPDLYIQNCRTGSCQRTDSIIFDEIDGLDAYYKVDFWDSQSTVSDYYTPSSTLTRPPKNKHTRNLSSVSGGTVYQDVAKSQSINMEKDPDTHKRYHNRSYSLVPQFVQDIPRGHKRSISATPTPGPSTSILEEMKGPMDPEPPIIVIDKAERSFKNNKKQDDPISEDHEKDTLSRKPSYETSL